MGPLELVDEAVDVVCDRTTRLHGVLLEELEQALLFLAPLDELDLGVAFGGRLQDPCFLFPLSLVVLIAEDALETLPRFGHLSEVGPLVEHRRPIPTSEWMKE